MSDVQTTNGSAEEKRDPTLRLRRLVAFILSFALGALTVALLEIFVLKVPAFSASFPIAFIPEVPLWPLVTLSMGFFFLIWIDYFMGTGILPD
jgi:hypothetical protein